MLPKRTLLRLAVGLAVTASLPTAVMASAATRDGRAATAAGDGPPDPGASVAGAPAPPVARPSADEPAATIATASGATTRPRAATTTSTAARLKKPASGQQAVAAFTTAVDRGDGAAAWRLLSPRSQAYWKTQARFASTMSELAEGGYGGWTRTRDKTARSVVVTSSGEGEILIVTLRGSTTVAGKPAVRARAFPVRHVKGTFLLELWDLGGGGTVPEVIGPGPVLDATVRTSDRTPTFQARAKGEEVAWALDDRDATMTNVSGTVAGYQPEQALRPGTHVLTVASVGRSWLTATAVVVHVT